MNFTLVRLSDGVPLQIVSGSLTEAPSDTPEGTSWIASSPPGNMHRWSQGAWAAHSPSVEALNAAAALRGREVRDDLLRDCDWTQAGDTPLTPQVTALWRAYRQALRNISTQPGFPHNIKWPTPP